MPHLVWESEAARQYYDLTQNAVGHAAQLLTSIDRVLDQLEFNPSAFTSRRRLLRTRTGVSIWKIEIRRGIDDWSLLWMEHPEDFDKILILNLGPAEYE